MKKLNTLLGSALFGILAASAPDISPTKKVQSYGKVMPKKKWEARKKRNKQQRISRKINRQS